LIFNWWKWVYLQRRTWLLFWYQWMLFRRRVCS